MALTQISPYSLKENVFQLIDKDWMLITAGKLTDFNCMTASWGGFGILWHKPVCFIFIRPTRFTYQFAEKFPTFTLSFFEEKFRQALQICGSMSGRDTNKIQLSGLTPFDIGEDTVSYEEARLIIKCRKLYHHDLTPVNFADPLIDKNYPKKDYHRMYIAEILTVNINTLK